MMVETKKSVCIIGAGPSGLFFQRALRSLSEEKFDITCYERNERIGGLWHFKGKAGSDDDGLPVQSSMFKNLRINGPNEYIEFIDLSLQSLPNFPTREEMLDQLDLYAEKYGLLQNIRFKSWVENVSYDDERKLFKVAVKDLTTGTIHGNVFDYVIISNGRFSNPNSVSYPGQDTFPGKILHSKDFIDAERFRGEKVLLVGASWSAEDLSLQLYNVGAKITISYRTQPIAYNWPEEVQQKELLTKIDGNTVHFKDGTSDTFDTIIYTTGYTISAPFMEDKLQLVCPNRFSLPLYQSIVLPSNRNVLYLGMQLYLITWPLLWQQANFAAKVVNGDITLPAEPEMIKFIKEEQEKEANVKNAHEMMKFQDGYISSLSEITGQKYRSLYPMFERMLSERIADPRSYRTHKYDSLYF